MHLRWLQCPGMRQRLLASPGTRPVRRRCERRRNHRVAVRRVTTNITVPLAIGTRRRHRPLQEGRQNTNRRHHRPPPLPLPREGSAVKSRVRAEAAAKIGPRRRGIIIITVAVAAVAEERGPRLAIGVTRIGARTRRGRERGIGTRDTNRRITVKNQNPPHPPPRRQGSTATSRAAGVAAANPMPRPLVIEGRRRGERRSGQRKEG